MLICVQIINIVERIILMGLNLGTWKCPKCDGALYVIDSLLIGDWIRRRSWCCVDCEWRFRSLEALDIRAAYKRGMPPGINKRFETQGVE
jgi:hypothetical protein